MDYDTNQIFYYLSSLNQRTYTVRIATGQCFSTGCLCGGCNVSTKPIRNILWKLVTLIDFIENETNVINFGKKWSLFFFAMHI